MRNPVRNPHASQSDSRGRFVRDTQAVDKETDGLGRREQAVSTIREEQCLGRPHGAKT